MMDDQYNRRATDRSKDSQVRKDILEQMSEIEDPQYRVLMTLMIRLQDETAQEVNELRQMMRSLIGSLRADIASLQRSDEWSRQHRDDHIWVEGQRKLDQACGIVLNQHGEDGLCEVARKAVKAAEAAQRRKWRVMDDLASDATKIGIGIVITLLLAKFFPGVVF
jgi:hypothetical protein